MVVRYGSDKELAARLKEQLASEEPPGALLGTAAREFNQNPHPDAAAAYAHLLLRSRERSHLSEAIVILSSLVRSESDPALLREHYYHLCIGYYLLGQYDRGLEAANELMTLDGKSSQCRAVKALMEESYNREAAVGLAMLGGAVAAGSAIAAGGLYLLAKAVTRR